MSSPFVFEIADLMKSRDGLPVHRRQVGPSPHRIGPEMIAIAADSEVTVDATLTPVGAGVLVDAVVNATLAGECVRCLNPLSPTLSLRVSQMFVADADVIAGDEADGEDEEVPYIVGDTVDLEQTVVDEAVLALPFNPTCEGGCPDSATTGVPEPDGVSGESEPERVDPRWSGLEKLR